MQERQPELEFIHLDRLVDGDLELVLVKEHPGDPSNGKVPTYYFNMAPVDGDEMLGVIVLRVGNNHDIIMYLGHVGYEVKPEHRGHHYAARSVKLLLPLAKQHHLNPLWITTNPDNHASRRTCELAGATLVEIVYLPKSYKAHQERARQRCRYRIDL